MIRSIRQRNYFIVAVATILTAGLATAQTPDCFSPSPSTQSKNPEKFFNSTLSSAEQKNLRKLLKKIEGKWSGDSQGFYCTKRKNDSPIADNYEISASASYNSNQFELRANMSSETRGGNNERIQYVLENNQLMLGTTGKNPVHIKSVSGNSFTIIEQLPQKLPGGGVAFREIERRFTVNDKQLQIDSIYYTHKKLSSGSNWTLSR